MTAKQKAWNDLAEEMKSRYGHWNKRDKARRKAFKDLRSTNLTLGQIRLVHLLVNGAPAKEDA